MNAWAARGFALLLVSGCAAQQSAPLDIARIQAELAAPPNDAPPPAAAHRAGGGVEVLVFSPAFRDGGDFRVSAEAENAQILAAVGSISPDTCRGGRASLSVSSVADGAFTKIGAPEKVVVLKNDCTVGRETRWSNTVVVLEGSRTVLRVDLPKDTTLARVADLFGDGRSVLVFETLSGPVGQWRVKASVARVSGTPSALSVVAESPSFDVRCSSLWDASAFIAVLDPRAPETPVFRTLKADARCERR